MTPSGRWIRLDVGWEESPWLDALPGEVAGCWPRLLCWVKRDGVRGTCKAPDHGVLARRWRVTRDAVTQLVDAAVADGALQCSQVTDTWTVTNWLTYQPTDSTTIQRSRRYRKDRSRLSTSRRDTVTKRDEAGTVTPSRRDARDDRDLLSRATGGGGGTGVVTTLTTDSASQSPGLGLALLEVQHANGNGNGYAQSDAAVWMHEAWQTELGSSRRLPLTTARVQKYRAMYSEHLTDAPNPQLAWRCVLRAVKASKHHMSDRAYQMPESLLKNPERRDTWVEKTVDLIEQSTKRTREADDFATMYRNRKAMA